MTLVPLNDINSGHYSRVVPIKGVTFNQVAIYGSLHYVAICLQKYFKL